MLRTRCENYTLFHFSANTVRHHTRLFLLRSKGCTTGKASCVHDSQPEIEVQSVMFPRLRSSDQKKKRREVKRNKRAQWRHNNYAGCSWHFRCEPECDCCVHTGPNKPHWCPEFSRADLNNANVKTTLVYKAHAGLAPQYISEMLSI